MLSPELKRSLDRAIQDTRRRRHEFITLEHLLHALARQRAEVHSRSNLVRRRHRRRQL